MNDRPPSQAVLTIASEQLEVGLLPGKGADVYSYVDRATGIDVLFKTPWGWHDPALLMPGPDSEADWLARYAGGWQMLLPNAGPPRMQDGALLGYHGEAAVRAWDVLHRERDSAMLAVDLLTVPVRIERTIRVTGPRLDVRDAVRNVSPDPVQVRWVQHPAFGAPFVDGDTRLDSSARKFLTDSRIPGTGVLADALTAFPLLPTATGGEDLRRIPGWTEPRAVFGAFTDFAEVESAWFSLTSPNAGFGVRLEWNTEIFPHAWFWQECHASPGFPWFRRAYVVAVEPANVLPGEGPAGALMRGAGPLLAAGQQLVAELSLTRFPLRAGVAPMSD